METNKKTGDTPMLRKALVVEDNVMDQSILKYYLDKNNYKSTLCSNGYDAMNVIESHDFDVVFIDIRMPMFNGFQLQKRIRSHCEKKSIPMVLMSAENTCESSVRRALKNGACDFIVKPVQYDTLAKKMERIESFYDRKIIVENSIVLTDISLPHIDFQVLHLTKEGIYAICQDNPDEKSLELVSKNLSILESNPLKAKIIKAIRLKGVQVLEIIFEKNQQELIAKVKQSFLLYKMKY